MSNLSKGKEEEENLDQKLKVEEEEEDFWKVFSGHVCGDDNFFLIKEQNHDSCK